MLGCLLGLRFSGGRICENSNHLRTPNHYFKNGGEIQFVLQKPKLKVFRGGRLSRPILPASLVFLLFSIQAQAGRRALGRQVSWHAAPHPLPFVFSCGRPISTSAVSVNIYWPSFSSPPPCCSPPRVHVCPRVLFPWLYSLTFRTLHTCTVPHSILNTKFHCFLTISTTYPTFSAAYHPIIMAVCNSRRKWRRKLLRFTPRLTLSAEFTSRRVRRENPCQ